MTEETPAPEAAPQEPEGWKLKKEQLPPGFLTLEQFQAKAGKTLSRQQREAAYWKFLFDQETGLFGYRPGNPWRMNRRRWIERFIVIQDKQTGKMIHMRLNEAQRALEAEIIRIERRGEPVRVCILKARQHGMSTYAAAFKVWMDLTIPNTRGLLMGHKKASAHVIHGRIDGMLQEIRHKDGKRWNIPIATNNRVEIELDWPFRSVTLVDSAEGPDYRGDTLRYFHAIEPAEWPKAEQKANAVTKCVPKAAGTYGFIEGTARGETGWFAETWKNAWKRRQYGEGMVGATVACFYPWFIHEKYRWSTVYGRPLPEKVKSEIEGTLSEEERGLLEKSYLRRGHGRVKIDLDQLAWRRMVIEDECQGSVEFFHQEYPSTPEEAFLSSGLRFFSSKQLAAVRSRFVRQPLWRGDTLDPEGEAKMMQALPAMEAREATA